MTRYKTKTHVKSRLGHRRPAESIVADLLLQLYHDVEPVVIAIGGPGGTGKSTFAGKLASLLPGASVFSMDDYKTPRDAREHRNLFGAHPEANDIALLRTHLQWIREAKAFEKPVYDNRSGCADSTFHYIPGRFNLLDGEISTYSQFRDLVDFSLFIDSDWKTQLNTRISRDIEERKYTREKAIATFLESNLREFKRFGAESKTWSDIHLYCREDYHLVVESVDEDIFHRFESMLQEDLAEVDLRGLIVPLCTPFSGNGVIDRKAFIQHLEYLAAHEVERILVAGTTGEFFSIRPEERKNLLSLARRYFPGMVLFQAGAEGWAMTLEQIGWAETLGADAVLILPPYYYANVTPDGLAGYFQALAAKTTLPVILYNFPKHTQLPLTPEILQRIPHFGLKDSSANLDLVTSTPNYYLGGDRRLLEGIQIGMAGFLSARANYFPDLFLRMEKALRQKDLIAAGRLQQQVNTLLESIGSPNEIQKVKTAINQILPDYPAYVRLPLLPLHKEVSQRVIAAVKRMIP